MTKTHLFTPVLSTLFSFFGTMTFVQHKQCSERSANDQDNANTNDGVNVAGEMLWGIS